VENFRPGVMDRLGYSPDALAQRFPSLVAVSLSGFGRTGPWSHRPAYDAVVQGMAGVMSITGSRTGPPVKPGIPIADLSAGLYGAIGVLAALFERDRPGGSRRGQHLDIAMFDTTLSLLEGAALRYLATGVSPDRIGNAHFSIAPFDTFGCADGDITICAANDLLFGILCGVIGLIPDERFATNAQRYENREALKALIETRLAGEPTATWLGRLETAGVPCGPVADIAAALGSQQAADRHMVVRAGGMRLPGSPIKSSAHADPLDRPAAPELDAHGAQLRAWLGLA